MQFIFALIVLLNIVFVSGKKCDKTKCDNYPFEEHYRDLQCEPVYSHGHDSCCSIRYKCPIISKMLQTRDECHYHGKVIQKGSSVSEIEGNKCNTATCSCVQHDEFSPASFICAAVGCGSYPSSENCRFKYDLNQCCPSLVCDKDPKLVKKCTVEGKEYKAGALFNLESDKCKSCVCGEDGEIQCKKVTCDLQLQKTGYITNYCAPVYYGTTRCCPTEFICPGNDVSIRTKKSSSSRDPESQCKFGANQLQIGDELSVRGRRCLSCKCTTPPFVTCLVDLKCTP